MVGLPQSDGAGHHRVDVVPAEPFVGAILQSLEAPAKPVETTTRHRRVR